ncbi:trans-aconitate 2-methyltransferase [Saccharothrix coeruleofusca]|uniref:trans-aconitate 2-methyltransferase n=1 Tax=Saccharothrix coeruleofusca TaxID=33919 RepID=UPI001AE34D28|nr:trans-aconitate 2-methyltransferase [Saccharothrix coeruleofusca]MBP2334298.1 trans-aconitate 2-methyltransferase [Saccharothrix coeruleofusca]
MWDPGKYLAFADHRSRPFHELVARVRAEAPRRVVDLGCGPGNLTTTLAERWPDAELEALDSSPEMVAAARERGLAASVGDITEWRPAPDTDVVISSAVLQWLPDQDALLRRWTTELSSGAWLALQVPGNFQAPSHELLLEVVRRSWPELEDLLRFHVFTPAGYAEVLEGCEVDAWETTYLHVLHGENAVLEWITGTALRPIRAALGDQEWAAFRAELAPLLARAYPRRTDGSTWFPFRRVFAVARVS